MFIDKGSIMSPVQNILVKILCSYVRSYEFL